MATLIFDIETVGEQWDELDEVTHHTLLRWVERSSRTDVERAVHTKDVQEGLGFSPLTGYIVAIGVYDLERQQGAIYYQGDGDEADETMGEYVLKQRNELAMLVDFWEGAKSYDTFVTFNGRCFDVPFLLHRSAIAGVQPTKNLMEGRYPYQQKSVRHVDLQDELTFFGAMHRRPNLHLFCRAYGIDSPKEEASGDEVAELFAKKPSRALARYNAADVTATTELYKKWRDYLSFPRTAPEDFGTIT